MQTLSNIRLFLIVWSAIMISAVESVGIRSEGLVELDKSAKDEYGKILVLTTSSFLADIGIEIRRRRKKKKTE